VTERTVARPETHLPARAERRLLVLDQFQLKPFLSVAELAETLGVSPMTVRRDLRHLAEDGVIRLEHGGALLVDRHALEGVFGQRERICAPEKDAIGRFAANMVRDGDVVGLDAGTTTLAIAHTLRPDGRVTVVTHSLPVIMELTSRPNVEVMALGGLLQAHTLAFAGPTVVAMLRGLRLHTLFLAATGFTVEDGMTCVSLYETDTKRALIEAARRVVLVADHTKLGRVFLMRVASLDAVHEIVTDAGLPDEVRCALEGRGLLVHIADAAPVDKEVSMIG
jgi:DeoR family fructose operon transcriptional repressor